MNETFDITGTWVNRMTGDKITVRNTFIDGDNMIIQTTDGRQISMNEFQNYIQMDDNEYDANGRAIGHGTSDIGNISLIENERRVIVGQQNIERTVIDNSFEEPISKMSKSKKQEHKQTNKLTESEKLLNKLFEKIKLDVDVDLNIDCNNFPVAELKMLQNFYDVSDEDISEYIIRNVINEDVFRSAVAAYIKERLSQ